MAKFENNLIILEDGDLEWETTNLSKNFWTWILGEPRIELSKGEKVNL
jgi:hypothetical protein